MNQEMNIRLDEMNWRTILKDVLYNLPLIIMAVLIVLMGVRTYKNIVYTPQYTTTSTLAVTAKGNAAGSIYSSLTTANAMAEVYSAVFEGDVMREKIEEVIGDIPDDVAISSELIPETNLLTLSVSAGSPKTAYQVIQAVMENYTTVSDYLFGNAVLEVIKKPMVPTAPSNYFPTDRYDKLGVLAAAAMMTAMIIFFSVIRNTVKMPKAAKRHLEGECLGVLPHEEKNRTWKTRFKGVNKGLLLSNPLVTFRFEESYHQLADCVDYKMKQHQEQILMVTSVAENEGKSTVAVNLAMAMAGRNRRVLLVDLDLVRPALYKLLEYDIPEGQTLSDYMEDKCSVSDVLLEDPEKNIFAVMNSKSIQDSQAYLISEKLEALLKTYRSQFDYIILDTSPLIAGADAENALACADASLLVVRQDMVSIADINDAVEDMKDSGTRFMGYVLNKFDRGGTGVHNRRKLRNEKYE